MYRPLTRPPALLPGPSLAYSLIPSLSGPLSPARSLLPRPSLARSLLPGPSRPLSRPFSHSLPLGPSLARPLSPSQAPSRRPSPLPTDSMSTHRGAASRQRHGAEVRGRRAGRGRSQGSSGETCVPRAKAAASRCRGALKTPAALLLGSFVRCRCSIGRPRQAPPQREETAGTRPGEGPARGRGGGARPSPCVRRRQGHGRSFYRGSAPS